MDHSVEWRATWEWSPSLWAFSIFSRVSLLKAVTSLTASAEGCEGKPSEQWKMTSWRRNPEGFTDLSFCSCCDQVVTNVPGAVITAAVQLETLLQLLLTISRQVQEFHVADGQLLTLWDLPQNSDLNPARDEGKRTWGFSSGVPALIIQAWLLTQSLINWFLWERWELHTLAESEE